MVGGVIPAGTRSLGGCFGEIPAGILNTVRLGFRPIDTTDDEMIPIGGRWVA